MMLKAIFALACFAVSAFAQGVVISAPAEWSTVSPGTNITVEVDKPDSLQASTDVAIVIAIETCTSFPNGECASFDVTESLGDLLYYGPYNPQRSNDTAKPPHQNFTVTVPSSLPEGQASLTVSHFVLVGLGPQPLLDLENITLYVA